MNIKEVARLAGISIRTLHYYDEIGLLKPAEKTANNYRVYSDDNLATIQQILFFKQLGFPLKKIKEILMNPHFNQLEALELQHKMLLNKQQQLTVMIQTIEKTIQNSKGEIMMTNEEKFTGFNFDNSAYEAEAKEKWGDAAVEKTKNNMLLKQDEMNIIYQYLATIRHLSPTSDEAQEGIARWFHYLNTIGSYSLEAFEGLGEVYITDERFTKNIDQFGEGLAQFMCDAMRIYAQTNQ